MVATLSQCPETTVPLPFATKQRKCCLKKRTIPNVRKAPVWPRGRENTETKAQIGLREPLPCHAATLPQATLLKFTFLRVDLCAPGTD